MQLIGENIQQIKVINLLGGEPTMSPKFWIFINWLATQDVSHLLLKITTNLSHPKLLEKLLLFKKHFKKIELNISIDGYKQKAEFTRYGLKWSQFEQYVDKLLTTLPDLDVDFIGTVNILSLDGLVENLDWRSSLKQKHSNRLRQACSVVRWPQFQSITILPKHIREHYAQELKQWVEHHKTEFTDDPYLGTTLFAIIKLLEADHNVPNIEGLQKDFKKFVIEFAGRRDLDIKQTFSKILTDWILEDNHGQTI
jgi:hypothetical protein